MIAVITFGILTIAAMIIMVLGAKIDNYSIFIAGVIMLFIFFALMVVASNLEGIEIRTACKTYCNERGYSYDTVEWEGEEQYCVCDTGLERHLITKTNEVIIE